MFTYFGGKGNLLDYYPKPKFDMIIEPFAGGAKYSLRYWYKDVLLIEKYEPVYKMWCWLQQCSPKDILTLPDLKKGDDIRKFDLTEEERIFLGFHVQSGAERANNIVSSRGEENWKTRKRSIGKELHKIKHWKIIHGDYTEAPDTDATWFIDPPYIKGGETYPIGNKSIDYKALAGWCKARKGQVIVCENSAADWMDFKPLTINHGQHAKTHEVVWLNYKTHLDNKQLTIKFDNHE